MKFRVTASTLMLAASAALSGGAAGWADDSLPQVEIVLPDGDARVGEAYPIEYRLTWPPGTEFWRVPAPEVPVDDESTTYRWSETAATLNADGQTMRFVLEVERELPGTIEIPGLDFSIYPDSTLTRNEKAPLKKAPESWHPGIEITTDPVVVEFHNPGVDPVFGFSALALFAVLGLSAVLWLTRGVSKTTRTEEPSHSTDPRELIHAARRARLDGDMHAFYQTLARAAGLVDTAGAKHLTDQFGNRAQEIGYGGAYPSDDELDAALKSIERELVAHGGSQ